VPFIVLIDHFPIYTMNRLFSLIVCTFFISFCSRKVDAILSKRGPIIGVFAHPIAEHGEYIAASYVKWIESAGGRVVPIPYNAPKEYLSVLVPQLNGLLYPGGAADVNDAAQFMFKLALQLNDQGTYFPVWGTCLGFEWILQMASGDLKILDHDLDSMNLTLPLIYTKKAATSRLFGSASADIYKNLETLPITMNNHEQGITIERLAQYPNVEAFLDVLSTNYDRNGRQFISAYEAKKYPIYAVQFHPEKNNFEYGEYDDGRPYEVVDHSYEAILTSQYFANFFIQEARRNDNRFNDAKVERKALIYNYQTFTITWPTFVESYIFKHDSKQTFWRVMKEEEL
jgi:gamma-glutamyl hydrolase